MINNLWTIMALSTVIMLGSLIDISLSAEKATKDNVILLSFTRSHNYDKLREELKKADSKRQQELNNINFGGIDYKILAVVDYDNDGKVDEVYVFHHIIQEGPYIGDAWIAHYIRYKGNWEFLGGLHTNGDILRVLDNNKPIPPVILLNGSEIKGQYFDFDGCYDRNINTRSRSGIWFDLEKVGKRDPKKNSKVAAIVKKEYEKLIIDEKDKFKRNMNYSYPEDLNIRGVMVDLNGDGIEDIVAVMNDMGQVARNVPKLFCEPQKGCLKILLLSNSEGNWEKHIIGNINCIGVGTKNNNGRRDIFKSRSTIIFDNNGIKEMDYSPNWNIPE